MFWKKPDPKRWEYIQVQIPTGIAREPTTEVLNTLGAFGYELVFYKDAPPDRLSKMTFKREVDDTRGVPTDTFKRMELKGFFVDYGQMEYNPRPLVERTY